MCGIVGLVSPVPLSSPLLLKKMAVAISHRGPDDSGVEISGGCGLGNRRLAVVDLSHNAHQPMWDEKKQYCITYNGEVYNFQTLKDQLIKKGYRFFSQSDTEVILNLYKEFGESCAKKLEGMFAFAIWDKRNKTLFLARDQLGIKPVYYFWSSGLFIFASEIKSILVHPRVKKELNFKAISEYFSVGFGTIPSPDSIFTNIYKLPPAHFATLKNNRLKINKYWHLDRIKPTDLSFPQAKEKLVELLSQSVKNQLVSDVPIGSFLSGGIDSSLIAALMQSHSRRKIKTFSIGFKERNFDESDFALKVAKKIGSDHYCQKFSAADALKALPKVISKLDEPMADASILPTFLLSHFTRQKVTVALSGDGGDELFGGYPTYFAHLFARPLSWIPPHWLEMLSPVAFKIAPLIPIMKHSKNLPSQFKIRRFLSGINKNIACQYLNFMGPINLKDKPNLFSQKASLNLPHKDPAIEYTNNLVKEADSFDRQKKLQYLDLKIYLAENGLTKTDRASSFNSLEVRVPFLTPKIAEFAFSLPGSYHFNGIILKRLLKSSAAGFLPQEIINRPKKGFGVPIYQWLKKDLKPLSQNLLNENRLKRQGIFDPSFVQKLAKEHYAGRESQQMILWPLLIFQLWYDKWFSS